MAKKAKTEAEKEKKPRKRKWSSGAVTPIEMPENPILKEVDAEIKMISEKESEYLKQKNKNANLWYILSVIFFFIILFIWAFANIFTSGDGVQVFRVLTLIFGIAVLAFTSKMFAIYAKQNSWINMRKKSVIGWSMVLFIALLILSLFAKF